MMNLDGQSVQTWIDLGIEVSKKLHDITVASCQVDQLFKDSQTETGEDSNFKAGKAQIGNRGQTNVQVGKFTLLLQKTCQVIRISHPDDGQND